jgi:molybdopterin-guanine dinucleotide biosynthesis protein A
MSGPVIQTSGTLETHQPPAAHVGGYVLAGGRSSRMGTDKAFLQLAGQPLIALATKKLRLITGHAFILAGAPPGNPALAQYGSLVCDSHPDCGPVGGIEAALRHTQHNWNLILPVDLPFLPVSLLIPWIDRITAGASIQPDRPRGSSMVRAAVFRAMGEIQPSVLLVHRALAPLIGQAVVRGHRRIVRVLEDALLAFQEEQGSPAVLHTEDIAAIDAPGFGEQLELIAPGHGTPQSLWFANVNTPEDFAAAQDYLSALAMCPPSGIPPSRSPG